MLNSLLKYYKQEIQNITYRHINTPSNHHQQKQQITIYKIDQQK